MVLKKTKYLVIWGGDLSMVIRHSLFVDECDLYLVVLVDYCYNGGSVV